MTLTRFECNETLYGIRWKLITVDRFRMVIFMVNIYRFWQLTAVK